MTIIGGIPSYQELITNNTLINAETWVPPIPSATTAIATGVLADVFGAWGVLLAAGTFTNLYVRPTQTNFVLMPVDAVYEVEYGYGAAGAPVLTTLGFARARRLTSGGVVMYPLMPVTAIAGRYWDDGVVNALQARIRCSVAGPQGCTIQTGCLVYPAGV